jgi:heme exporter protein C
MRKAFVPVLVVACALLVAAPIVIAEAPYESTMGLIQKIFYYHVPSWIAMFEAILVCGGASAIYLFNGNRAADCYGVAGAEVAVVFGLMGLVTGPLWARIAWGVWWQWDAKLTSALLMELIFVAYLMVRQFGGPGAEKLASATALFGTATAPFVYKSVDIWRTVHPKTSVVPTLPAPLAVPLALSAFAFLVLCSLILTVRVNLAQRQATLDALYLAEED